MDFYLTTGANTFLYFQINWNANLIFIKNFSICFDSFIYTVNNLS